jgi:TatD DNase family protein
VIHAFSGSVEVARELQGLGFHLGFGCSLANPANARGPKAVRAVAEERLLLETDAPDIPPRHVPGFEDCALNEPAHIRLAAEAAARMRGAELESTAAQACRNAERVFGGLLP